MVASDFGSLQAFRMVSVVFIEALLCSCIRRVARAQQNA